VCSGVIEENDRAVLVSLVEPVGEARVISLLDHDGQCRAGGGGVSGFRR
jgi:hypothetical protein